jgi:hypothetical protein
MSRESVESVTAEAVTLYSGEPIIGDVVQKSCGEIQALGLQKREKEKKNDLVGRKRVQMALELIGSCMEG